MSLLLVLGAFSGGASASSVSKAPYAGVHTGTTSSTSHSGCGVATISAKPYFFGRTGTGGFAAAAKSPSCTNPAGSTASVSLGFTSFLALPLNSSKVSLRADTSISAWIVDHIVQGKCTAATGSTYPICDQATTVYVYGSVYLYDKSTQQSWYSSSYWSGWYSDAYAYRSCYGGSCSTITSTYQAGQHSAAVTWWLNASSLNSSHHFVLVLSFTGYVYSTVYTYGASLSGGSTRGVLDFTSGGNGVDLTSVTVK
ncbi:MAG: hypothetical protein L3K09_07960 [Thermoplasmata archaeon]|nr:hypothetical protein [Thermoplasmata archaeon]